jgi:antitoxin ParD1/3/4
MDISLTPEIERRIAEKVQSGLYSTSSEVVREGMRRFFEAEVQRDRLKDKLDAEIRIGLAQSVRGERVDGPSFFARLREETEARIK